MKRLVVTGIPCRPAAWEAFLGPSKHQRILSMFEIFENTQSSDPRQLAEYVQSQIEAYQPQSIVCHNMGVPLTILSLLRLRKRGVGLRTRLTLFDGAFRRVDVFRANQPLRIQFMSMNQAIREVESHGCQIDRRLEKHFGRIRAMYRMILLYGMVEKVSSSLGLEHFLGLPSRFPLRIPIQMIVSTNDPYIPADAITQLRIDCGVQRYFTTEYGHFPYTGDRSKILGLLDEFERMAFSLDTPSKHIKHDRGAVSEARS